MRKKRSEYKRKTPDFDNKAMTLPSFVSCKQIPLKYNSKKDADTEQSSNNTRFLGKSTTPENGDIRHIASTENKHSWNDFNQTEMMSQEISV